MSLAPIQVPGTTGAVSTPRVSLVFNNNQADLTQKDAVVYLSKVIHKVQTSQSFLRPFIMNHQVEGTFDFVNLMNKRDPKKQTNVFRPLSALSDGSNVFDDTTYENAGIYVEPYDDMVWLPEYVRTFSRINFDGSVAVSMMKGFTRLEDRQILAGTVLPVIRTDTEPKGSGSFEFGWRDATRDSNVRNLPNTQIFGYVDNSNLLVPDFNAIQLLINAFKKQNVGPGLQLCAAYTPTMLVHLQRITQFQNKDYIFHKSPDSDSTEPSGVSTFMGIKWVEITPEVSLGAYYADKYLPKSGGATVKKLVSATDTASTNIDLTMTDHEVIPFFWADNLILGHKQKLNKWGVILQPTFMNEAVMYGRLWTGATRYQDVLQAHLIIPTAI